MYIPPFISIVWQRKKTDCSVACLAMLANVTYEDALLAIGRKRVLKSGIELKEVIRAGGELGVKLRLHYRVDLGEDTGILGIRAEGWEYDHLVILHNGTIIDPEDRTSWDPETYLSAHKAKTIGILTRENKPKEDK